MSLAALSATCLGCGCTCDDIRLTEAGGRVAAAEIDCELGRGWFGQRVSTAPPPPLAGAIEEAARLLRRAEARPLVYLAAGLSVEAQRVAVEIADRLEGFLDSITAETAGPLLLALQRGGGSLATLGTLRHRADLVVLWAVRPEATHPRLFSRFAAGRDHPPGMIAVDVGPERGPRPADLCVVVAPEEERDALAALAALARGASEAAAGARPALTDLGARLAAARHALLVFDGETSVGREGRAEGILALAESLNDGGPTRCTVLPLRGGGNRCGADAVLTWQTGYPLAVDFGRGYPTYAPRRRVVDLVGHGLVGVALVAGEAASVPPPVRRALESIPVVAVGPEADRLGAAIAIRTGYAGIHEGGTAVRLDGVPLPLASVIPGAASAVGTLQGIADRLADGGETP